MNQKWEPCMGRADIPVPMTGLRTTRPPRLDATAISTMDVGEIVGTIGDTQAIDPADLKSLG